MNSKKKFTELFPTDLVFNEGSRIQKGNKIVAILKDVKGNLSTSTCLDLGCSIGIISRLLAENFKDVIGVDVDKQAIKKAQMVNKKNNIRFLLSKERKIPLKNNQVDVVVCNQVYEHVKNPEFLFDEIYRVLRPKGVVLFGARNKYSLWDGHYSIPLIAWMPRFLANLLFKGFIKKDEYDINLYSLMKLNNLIKKFIKEDYTLRVISDPAKFASVDILPSSPILSKIIFFMGVIFYFFIPNYIWILRKK